MTAEELQTIVAAVLAALHTNSKTIAQLTEATQLANNDYFELNGGRKVSYQSLAANMLSGVSEWADTVPNIEASTLLLNVTNCRFVLLDSMGSTLDCLEYTPVAGDKIFTNGYIFTWNGTGYDQDGIAPKKHVVYMNKNTGKHYMWDGSNMVELVDILSGRQVIDYILTTPSFESIEVGEMYYMSSSKKLIVKISDTKTVTFDPDPYKIYYARDARKQVIWDVDSHSWQQVS